MDGGTYETQDQKIDDDERTRVLSEIGFTIIRFTNNEVLSSIEKVIKKIQEALVKSEIPSNKENIDSIEFSHSSPRSGEGQGVRETSTMPGYAGSSWYFLRYMDPHNNKTFCDRKVSDYWNQVDLYIGGTEHAVGHLLYSRMWTKVMYDLGMIGFDEPYKKLLNQGMIQGSSRFVYRIDSIGNNRLDFSLFVSDGIAEKCKNDSNYAVDLVNRVLFDDVKKYTGDKFSKDNKVIISQLHVDVNIVDGIDLDIKAFRNWKPEFKDAIIICEDAEVSLPLSFGEGLGVRSNSKYIYGVATEKMYNSKYNKVNTDKLCEK